MEDGLRVVSTALFVAQCVVLILVLMEDGLREVNLQLADLQTFRAQKCSKFQKSREKKYIFRLQKYNFFRLNNMISISFSQKSRRLSLRTFSSVVLLNSVCSPMARTWGGGRVFCRSPRLRPGLLSLCSVTSFRRFSVFFPQKSRRLSLRTLCLCGFIKFSVLAYDSHVGFRKTVCFWIL